MKFLRERVPEAMHALGPEDDTTLKLQWLLCQVLYDSGTTEETREAIAILESISRTTRRVFGRDHPLSKGIEAFRSSSEDYRAAVLRLRKELSKTKC